MESGLEDAFADAERYFLGMVTELQSASAAVKLLEELESDLSFEVRELGRRLLQGHIDSRGTGDIGRSIVSSEGVELCHRRVMELGLHTLFGKITIRRTGYSRRGYGNVFPLDAALNLPSCSYSYGLQRLLAKQSASTSFEEALALIEELTGVKLGKRQGLSIVQECAVHFDEFYDTRSVMLSKEEEKQVAESPLMVLTTDGKGVVMRPEGLRDATRKMKEKEKRSSKPHQPKSKEKNNRKRMAQVASIYLIERFM